VDNDRELAERGNIGCQQVRADGGTAHAADDDLSDASAIQQRLLLTQLPGGLKLSWKSLNLAKHILGVELREGMQIVEIHESDWPFLTILLVTARRIKKI
jgi:hypothetical protein